MISIEVVCTPANMPAEFTVDVSDMQPHGVIRLSDLKLPKGVTATGDPDMPIVTVLTTAAATADAAEEGGEAAAEGGEGEAAEGE